MVSSMKQSKFNKKNSRLPQIDYEKNDGSFVVNLEDQITLF